MSEHSPSKIDKENELPKKDIYYLHKVARQAMELIDTLNETLSEDTRMHLETEFTEGTLIKLSNFHSNIEDTIREFDPNHSRNQFLNYDRLTQNTLVFVIQGNYETVGVYYNGSLVREIEQMERHLDIMPEVIIQYPATIVEIYELADNGFKRYKNMDYSFCSTLGDYQENELEFVSSENK